MTTGNRKKESFSIARVYDHFKNNSFGILSAYLAHLPKEVNIGRNIHLFEMLKSYGIAYVPIKGVYGLPEKSVFLPGVEPDVVKDLAKAFDQESYVWGEKGTWMLVMTATDVIDRYGTDFRVTSAEKAEDYYSEYKGRKFQLERTKEEELEQDGE